MKTMRALAQIIADEPTIECGEMRDAIVCLDQSIAVSSRTCNVVFLKVYRLMRILKMAAELREIQHTDGRATDVVASRPTCLQPDKV